MLRPHSLPLVVLFALVVLPLASCGDAAVDNADTTLAVATTTVETSTTTTTMAAPTTRVEATTTTVSSSESGMTVIEDIVYLEMGGHEFLVDVYVPATDGPWPVVLALHGGIVLKDHSTNTRVAEAAAEAGMVVFAPNYVEQWPDGLVIGVEDMNAYIAALRCALAYSQQEAASFGGDASRTVVYGVSAGASTGSSLVLHPTTELPEGCRTQGLPVPPVGAVFGDADYFAYTGIFDGGFDTDPEGMQTFGAGNIDPYSWPADLSTRFRFWAAASGTFPRSFDDPWDEDGWFAQRDPDGTIREDFDELGALDDGTVDYIDNGLLLATRLQQAGVDATIDIYPGDHTPTDKIPEIVAYLLDVSRAS